MEPSDDDSTVIRPSVEGQQSAKLSIGPVPVNALPPGTVLGEFTLTDVIGEGGFSIVYLAWDRSLKRRVAVKEYIPASLATRSADLRVTVRSERVRETFEAGLKSFINEAQLLAQFDHPSLVKVYRFWEDRGTAFMVMPWYRGPTVKEALRARTAPPDEAWLLRFLDRLTQALSVLHAQQCYHRDVAPDNIILVGASETPLLLDLGAARRVIADMTHTPTVILKTGYAPLEQYDEVPGMHQGPWTDVYALAAVVYYAICGRTPPAAVGRFVSDTFVPLTQCAAGRYETHFLAAIDRALAVRPDDRTSSVAELRQQLGLAKLGNVGESMPGTSPEQPVAEASDARKGGVPPARSTAQSAAEKTSATAWTRRWLFPAIISLSIAAAAIVGWKLMPRAGAPKVTAASVPIGPPRDPVSQPPRSPAATPFSPSRELDAVVAAATPGIEVEAGADRTVLKIGRDRLAFHIRSSREGYVYVLVLGPDGSLARLFPNARAQSNRIRPGELLRLPTKSWSVDTVEPTGVEHFLVIVSDRPRDFGRLEKKIEDGIALLDTRQAAQDLASRTPSRPIYAGQPVCIPQDPCSEAYGAASFDVQVVR